MDKKRYFRTSVSSIILQSITITFCGASFYFFGFFLIGMIKLGKENPDIGINIFLIIVLFLGGLTFIYTLTTFYKGIVCLEKDKIVSYGDNRVGRSKFQYPAFANYTDIKDVRVLALNRKSDGSSALIVRPIPYLVISTDKRDVRFAIYMMRKETVRQLLTDLVDRCNLVNNYLTFDAEQLVKDFSKAVWATEEF